MAKPLIVALSRVAARVRQGRTTDEVLAIAGRGARRLGLRLAAFQVLRDDLVLRYFATTPARQRAIEALVGRPLEGLRAPIARLDLVSEVIGGRHVYRGNHDLFDKFLLDSTGHDLAPLDTSPSTAGIPNGVLAPLFVARRPWGLLAVASRHIREEDAAAVALFATQVGCALEAAECVDELVRREQLAVLGELSAVVAHEIRNPLGTIFNTLSLLRHVLGTPGLEGAAAEESRRLLSILNEEADRMNGIVADLLDLGRPAPLHLARASLREIAEDVVISARRRPEAENVALCLDAPEDLVPVDVDVRFVRQAICNLVVNGLQAMPEGGTLTVRARVHSGARPARSEAIVEVIDTGPGITPEVRRRLFEPFFTTKATGTGLGLAVVKRAAELHGGQILFESGAGVTTFALRLPVRRSPSDRQTAPRGGRGTGSNGGARAEPRELASAGGPTAGA